MSIKGAAYICLIGGILIGLWVLFAGGYILEMPIFEIPTPDVNKAREIQPFFTGLVAPMLTLGTTLLLLANLKTTTEQNFSTNFFKLIDFHNRLVENINTTIINISTEDKPSKGREFFDDLAHRIANDYYCILWQNYNSPSGNLPISIDLLELAKDKRGKILLLTIYDYYFQIHQSDLGHYFRNLYHILRFAERYNINHKIKVDHIHILRAQLSNYEILLLSYNGLHQYGAKFHPLIEKYELLKNLNTEENLSPLRTKRIVDLEILTDGYPNFKKFRIEEGDFAQKT